MNQRCCDPEVDASVPKRKTNKNTHQVSSERTCHLVSCRCYNTKPWHPLTTLI